MSEQLFPRTTSGGPLLRRPRDTKSFGEFHVVRKFKSSERIVEHINLEGDLRVALIFPNTYEVAISSLGFNLVWKWFNRISQVRCERFFLDKNFNKFYSLDTQTPLDEFPIWAFVMHFENDFLNVLWLLKKKAIPVFNMQRRNFDPLIVFGGALTYVDLPIFSVVADVILHGDFEAMIEDLQEVLMYENREKLIEKISQLDFATVPVCKKMRKSIAIFDNIYSLIPSSPLICSKGEFANRLLIEIERGCPWGCNFCMMGALKKPVRFLDPHTLKEALKDHNSAGLIASNVTDYPWLDEMIPWFEERKLQVSFSSLRLDRLNENFLKFLKKNQQSFTIAPESLSNKIRKVLGKNFTDQQILDALLQARKVGFEEVKMYIIYGLDEESDQDLSQIKDFANMIREMGYKQIKFSLNPLVPKRGTKMASYKMQDLKILKDKMKMIKKLVGQNAKVVFESITAAYLQYLINSADEYNCYELVQKLEHLSIDSRISRDHFL